MYIRSVVSNRRKAASPGPFYRLPLRPSRAGAERRLLNGRSHSAHKLDTESSWIRVSPPQNADLPQHRPSARNVCCESSPRCAGARSRARAVPSPAARRSTGSIAYSVTDHQTGPPRRQAQGGPQMPRLLRVSQRPLPFLKEARAAPKPRARSRPRQRLPKFGPQITPIINPSQILSPAGSQTSPRLQGQPTAAVRISTSMMKGLRSK